MKIKSLIIVIGFLSLVVFFANSSKAEIMDRIVAVVNGQIITMEEIDRRINVLKKQTTIADDNQLKKAQQEILAVLVDRMLIMQEFENLGHVMVPEEVTNTIDFLLDQNGLSQKDFDAYLAKNRLTSEMFRKNIEFELKRSRIIEKELKARIIIMDTAVDNYLKEHPEEFKLKKRVHLKMLVLDLKGDTSKEAMKKAEEKAQKIIKEINNGKKFTTAVKEYSEGRNSKDGGDLGLVVLDELSAVLKEVAAGLKDGEISGPVRMGNAVLILYLVKHMDVDENDVRKASEIIKERLMNQKLDLKYKDWLEGIRKKAIIDNKL